MRNSVIVAILASSVFVSIFLNSVFNNLNKPLTDYDSFFNYFILDNNLDKLSKFDFEHMLDTRMFYPHKNTLVYGNSYFAQSFLALPFFLLTRNPIISTNLMLIATIFLSFLAMFTLTHYYTKNLVASIIGSVIFTFNPYVMASSFPGALDLMTLQWIPLIFLFSEKLVRKVTWKNSLILTALFFMQVISSLYYFMYLIIIWPIFLLIRIYFEKIKLNFFLHPAILVSILLFVIAIYFYAQPYISVNQVVGIKRSIEINIYHSAQFADFLQKTNAPNPPNEHSLFMGWTVYFLIIISFWLTIKGKFGLNDRLTVKMYLLFFLLCIILSFGPYLVNGNYIIMPLPYLLFYKIIPFFDGMRIPSTFIVMADFSAAIIQAFCLSYFLKYISKIKIKILVLVVISTILLFEYWQKPIPLFYIKPEILSFYSWLDTSDSRAIAELPIANGIPTNSRMERSFMLDSRYLLYGTLHHKYLINGLSAFIPNYAYILGNSLTLNFPTPSKIDQLKKMGVNLIIVHLDEYKDIADGKKTVSYLEQLNLKKVYNSENISAFAI